MNNLDNHTVLEIIKMLDNRIDIADKKARESYPSDLDYLCQTAALIVFRDHLQEYIEAQVSQVEQ